MSEQQHPFYECQVQQVRLLGNDVYFVELAGQEQLPTYSAGQYLMLELADGSLCPFSIASSPMQNVLELHIRRLPGHDEADKIISHLKQHNKVRVQMPFGRCLLTDSDRPAIFIAGGTGFAPFHSIIKTALSSDSARPLTLYWGAQTSKDLYLLPEPLQWAEDKENFNFIPVLSGIDPDWDGRVGFVHHAFMLDHDDITAMDIYVAGSEPMVMSVYQDLLERGVDKANIHSDILHIKQQFGQLD